MFEWTPETNEDEDERERNIYVGLFLKLERIYQNAKSHNVDLLSTKANVNDP